MGDSVVKPFCWVVMVIMLLLGINGSKGCLEEEREGLLKLKEAFNYSNGSALSSWNPTDHHADCCTWEGVKCDNSTKRVITLALNYTRPSELQDMKWSLNASHFLPFQRLQILDLSGNYLSGLFGEIRLDNLQKLKLRDNQLKQIPSFGALQIANNFLSFSFKQIGDADFSFNLLEGGLPESIMRLTSLTSLRFYVNKLNDSLPQKGGLCNLKNLISLDLAHNEFEGHLPPCLSNLTSLRLLDVSENYFVGTLPSSLLYSLKPLAYISLCNTYLSGSLSLSSLANHSNLQVIGLWCSYSNLNIETENPPFLPSFQLKIFTVSNCTLNEASENRIPTFLFHQNDLRYLELGRSNISGSFPNWVLANNSKLDYFNLNHNFLTGPLELNSTSKFLDMHAFDVSSNPIKGEIPSHIGSVFPNLISLNMSSSSLHGGFPASIGDMIQLNDLDLSNNNLSGYLPQEFGKGSNDLRILKLSNNNLSGPCLPMGSNFSHLLFVDLNNNNFSGKVPDAIIKNSELRMLDLSANQLFGEMPSWIGSLWHLGYLVLSQNSLAGQIPESFCNLTELTYLDLSQNSFSGVLPSCLNMPLLRYLHLQSNQFMGPIPSTLAKSPFLLTLDLTKNKFSGQVLAWFSSFTKLRVLLLRENILEGSIPIELCKLKSICILDLSRNKLSGVIPYCLNNITFGRMDALNRTVIGKFIVPWFTKTTEYVYNPYSGELLQGENQRDFAWYKEQEVDFMSKTRYESYKGSILDFMSGLDLSSNQLTGEIPSQIGYLSGIHTLNFSNNHLTGSIPETFSNLKQIESLDLSYNKLRGHIPAQLTELYYLSIFSVAHNNLSGMTPDMKNQFSTFGPRSYEGNPFLCGPPLSYNCSSIDKSTRKDKIPSHLSNDDFRDTFLWSFAGTFVVAFLGVIAFLYFNSYFSNYRPFGRKITWYLYR